MSEKSEAQKPPQRVICYVDGFNLYYGLRDSNLRRFLWLDLHELARRLVLPNQVVTATKYFTARITGGRYNDPPAIFDERNAKRKRQSDYLDALQAHAPALAIYEGHFLAKEIVCNNCNGSWGSAEEKMTDVNIATELLVDAFANRFDTALIVSGDSDLVPPIRAVRNCFPHKRVIVAFPPSRASVDLRNAAHGQFVVSKGQLKKSQLPLKVVTQAGVVLECPPSWMAKAP